MGHVGSQFTKGLPRIEFRANSGWENNKDGLRAIMVELALALDLVAELVLWSGNAKTAMFHFVQKTLGASALSARVIDRKYPMVSPGGRFGGIPSHTRNPLCTTWK